MKLKTLGLIGMLSILLAGCRNAPTPESNQVRRIQADGATQCKFLGVGTSSYAMGMSLQDDISQARIAMRNKVAATGGNAYVMNHSATTIGYTEIEFDMYKCPNR